MNSRIRRTDRYRAALTNSNGSEQAIVPAFFASHFMAPPDGAYGASDLEGRPGTLASCPEHGTQRELYDVSCPGCGRVFALDPETQPITGDPGAGYANTLTCAVQIQFRGCCGWHGHLREGKWVPLSPAGQDAPAK